MGEAEALSWLREERVWEPAEAAAQVVAEQDALSDGSVPLSGLLPFEMARQRLAGAFV